ncbi:MAG: DNA alkylation repair protein [Lachnospiraceae bacterium]|nr:DNA alkylation repair protein [Lachnospiraceae bacterium]
MITAENIKDVLKGYVDEKFKDFTSALIPGDRPIIGVRVPILRKLAKEIAKGDWKTYLKTAPEDTYEDVAIKGFVIGYVKAELKSLLPYIAEHIEKINDWSLCDGFCSNLKVVEKYREKFLEFLLPYAKIDDEFKQRVVAVMLMTYYLTDDYIDMTLEVLDSLKNERYYCKMAVAWAIATAWAKQREKTCCYMQDGNNTLDDWTYNKAIQKMLESYRVSDEDKSILRQMKRNKEL